MRSWLLIVVLAVLYACPLGSLMPVQAGIIPTVDYAPYAPCDAVRWSVRPGARRVLRAVPAAASDSNSGT